MRLFRFVSVSVFVMAAAGGCAVDAATTDDSSGSPPGEAVEQSGFAVESDDPRGCSIRLGASGNNYDYRGSLRPGETLEFPVISTSDFVRSTIGPCHFELFNGSEFSGKSVTVGSDLVERIRVGIDGVVNREDGGGDTWRARSLRIKRVDTTCRLNIGGNGIRMNYYIGEEPKTPAMDRIESLTGSDCRGYIWNETSFGQNNYDNRYKAILARGATGTYDPGFKARSLKVWTNGNDCQPFTKQDGRCLPQTWLDRRIYDNPVAGDDRDQDGLNDALENELAEAFRPFYVNHENEDATRLNVYTTASGKRVIEPVTVFQVRPGDEENTIVLSYMKLWARDRWDALGFDAVNKCAGHYGDSQSNSITLRTTQPGSAGHGRLFWVAATSGGIGGDLAWSQDRPSIRGPHFVHGGGERGIPNHLVIHFSKGKHHEYADGGWSGQDDKDEGCSSWITAHTNGRGWRNGMPGREAVLEAPAPVNGRHYGDRFGMNNVGSRAHPNFNDLTAWGFPEQCVWNCGPFYDSDNASVSKYMQ